MTENWCTKWKQTTNLNIPKKEVDAYVSTLDEEDRDLFGLVKENIQDDAMALAVCVVWYVRERRGGEVRGERGERERGGGRGKRERRGSTEVEQLSNRFFSANGKHLGQKKNRRVKARDYQ